MIEFLKRFNWWLWAPVIIIAYLVVIGIFLLFFKGSSIREGEERIEKLRKEETENDQRR